MTPRGGCFSRAPPFTKHDHPSYLLRHVKAGAHGPSHYNSRCALTSSKKLAKTTIPSQPATKRTRFLTGRNLKILIVLAIAAIAVSSIVAFRSSFGSQPRAVIIDWQVFVFAGSYNATHFVTPSASNIEAKGSFTAVGGNGEVLVRILSESDFLTYIAAGSNPPTATTYYDSGTVHMGSFDIHLPPNGSFYIVFSDNFKEGRAVTASGFLYY